jgi:hypothetical protein
MTICFHLFYPFPNTVGCHIPTVKILFNACLNAMRAPEFKTYHLNALLMLLFPFCITMNYIKSLQISDGYLTCDIKCHCVNICISSELKYNILNAPAISIIWE